MSSEADKIISSLNKPATTPGVESDWVLEATDQTNYVGAPVANGCIGILPWCEPFSIRHVIMNHIFEFSKEHDVFCVIKGINPFLIKMKIGGIEVNNNNISDWKQIINMKEATHTTSFSFQNQAKVQYRVVALRGMPFAGLVSVTVENIGNESISIIASNPHDVPSECYDTSSVHSEFHQLNDGSTIVKVFQTSAKTKFGSHTVCASSCFRNDGTGNILYNEKENDHYISFESVKKGEVISFDLIGDICTTREYADVFTESERQICFAAVETPKNLILKHQRLWIELWEGDIIIEGDLALQRIVRFCLFNLYSFCRAGSRLSISPMGLSCTFYNGHIFWDSELWMFPPLLLLNEPIAKSFVDYRVDRKAGARRRAYAHGYNGLMYPWESEDNGDESTPTWAFTGPLEHHVTADVGIELWSYYQATHDKRWLKKEGYPVLEQIAEFWVSRVSKNDDGTYSIERVVGADEYAIDVTDNAFTNGAAKKVLEYATKAAETLGIQANPKWKEIASNMKFWYFEDGTMKEYKGYDGRMIKQADVNLLGYPLNIVASIEAQKRDLQFYENRIDPENGPLMSYSAFVIQHSRHQNVEKASELLSKCFAPNLRPPFGVLSETPTSQNPYFATGAGGLLQAVINGFCGLELTDDGIIQVPSVLPKGWKKLTVKGVGINRQTYVRE